MAVSRRFDSRWRVSFSSYIVGQGTIKNRSTVDSLEYMSQQMNINVPPSGYYAFYHDYYYGRGNQVFIASPYSTGLKYWDDETWGLKKYSVTWYDDTDTPVLTGYYDTPTGRYETTVNSINYRMRLSFWHQVDVINNSEYPVTVYSRSFLQHVFASNTNDWGSDQMTSWSGTEVDAGASLLVSGFRPLEIKFNAESTTRDLLGVTLQDGSKTLLLF